MTEGMRKAVDDSRDRMDAARESAGERMTGARNAATERVEAAKAATSERVETAKIATAEKVEIAKAAAEELQAKVKPKLRGVIHEYAFPVSLVAGAVLILTSANGQERLALGIYALSLSALLGVSALYHRVNWKRPSRRMWMRRLDHAMIFLLIAGTVTPFAVLAADGSLTDVALIAIWSAAAAGIVIEVVWVHAPKWVSAIVYSVVGLIGALVFPAVVIEAGLIAGVLVAAGGLLYLAGAVVYASERPDPNPAVFGYHEIFHVLVVVAAAAHFAAIALYAGPTG